MSMHNPPHPGEVIKDVLIDGAELSVTDGAERLGVTRTTLSRLINGHTGISAEMALRLSMLLNTSIDMWLKLQNEYDKWQIKKQAKNIKIKPLDGAA